MAKTFHLQVITPFGEYYSGEVEFISVKTSSYLLGILPKHQALISDLVISEMIIQIDGKRASYAISGGLIRIDNGGDVSLMLQSVERSDEIDVERAKAAMERAKQELVNNQNDKIAMAKAKLAIERAVNRINISSKS